MKDLISRQAAIEAIDKLDNNPNAWLDCAVETIEKLPSVQPERLTDDDFETIRVHLNAYKEKLCNQQRWEEADEYQRIIDRFMAFASAQPELIRCKDCKHYHPNYCAVWIRFDTIKTKPNDFCSRAERREDE